MIPDNVDCPLHQIMECTLRDGSYVNQFQFTQEDTRHLVAALDKLGFQYIEVGHGMGIGASQLGGKFSAAETDRTYMQATQSSIHRGKWGMFCIPGIAKKQHLTQCAEYQMDFIRLGCNVDSYKELEPFIKAARQLNLEVFVNLMKSYTLAPVEFAIKALEISKYGIDHLYIVDSSGGMLPNELGHYIEETQARCPDLSLGFHGHNNLGLGVANSLKALDMGVSIVDSTLQGYGRSAGNTPTEQLVAALYRTQKPSEQHDSLRTQIIDIMVLGETWVQPRIERKGLSSIDIVSGMGLFHSSYMPLIQRYATSYEVDPRELILAVCDYSQSDAPEQLVEAQAEALAQKRTKETSKVYFKTYVGGEQSC